MLIGGSFEERGVSSVSSWCVFWRVLVQCIYLVLFLLIDWFWILLEMLWLFSVSVWRMGSVSSVMVLTASVCYLSMLSSGRVNHEARAVFGIWVRELLSVGYL